MNEFHARFKQLFLYPKIMVFTVYSLTFNAFQSQSPLADCVFEPVIWIVDHFTGMLGRALVILVVLLTSTVVVIFYTNVIPIVLEYENVVLSACHLIFGHWLLLNIVFHYYKAVLTNPGHPATGGKVAALKDIQVCTKCMEVKPPRTHHCSICKKCVLKMDHHCPWINNCVGHFNHRYFFLFCVYMCLGTIYVSLTLLPTFFDHINFIARDIIKSYIVGNSSIPSKGQNKYLLRPKVVENKEEDRESIKSAVVFEFMLCSCVALAVGALAGWHFWLICNGETSIEVYINKKNRKKAKQEGKKYVNPYNYGLIRNCKMVFGLGRSRGLLSILLPSSHPPHGDGVTWPLRELPNAENSYAVNNDKAIFMA